MRPWVRAPAPPKINKQQADKLEKQREEELGRNPDGRELARMAQGLCSAPAAVVKNACYPNIQEAGAGERGVCVGGWGAQGHLLLLTQGQPGLQEIQSERSGWLPKE